MEENSLFKKARLRLTLEYTAMFAVLFLLIVLLSNILIWGTLIRYKKNELVNLTKEEAREYIEYSDFPVGDAEVRNGKTMAYMRNIHGMPILDLMGTTPEGLALLARQGLWPNHDENAILLNINHKDKDFHFLACRVFVKENGEPYGHLYIFENVNNYYRATMRIFVIQGWVFLFLIFLSAFLGYYFSGKNLKPLKNAYEKERQFTADASHEMRMPLSVIGLATQSVLEDEDNKFSDFSRESMGMIKEEITRLSHLTESLTGLAREDSSEFQLNNKKIKINLSCLVADTVKELSIIAEKKEIEIITETEDNIFIKADIDAVKRLIIILVDNAIKYSDNGSKVTLMLCRNNKNICFDVKDEGCGIADTEKQAVFQRFYRVDKARSRSQGGNGLGLSLAKAIVQRHNGKIWVIDNHPCGSIFKVMFPC